MFEALNDKEKDILRLLALGFDQKAVAAKLGVTDGSVTERLRETRRKLGVPSSREAARLFMEYEGGHHKLFVDKKFGIDDGPYHPPSPVLPDERAEAGTGTPRKAVREDQASFTLFPTLAGGIRHLPLRERGEIGNSLNRRERANAIVEMTTKFATIFALVCLIAILVNLLVQQF